MEAEAEVEEVEEVCFCDRIDPAPRGRAARTPASAATRPTLY
jgi:hypothetical protein